VVGLSIVAVFWGKGWWAEVVAVFWGKGWWVYHADFGSNQQAVAFQSQHDDLE